MPATDALALFAFALLGTGGVLALQSWLASTTLAFERPWDDEAGVSEAAFVDGGSKR